LIGCSGDLISLREIVDLIVLCLLTLLPSPG
jgi:hypothetical protein